MALLVGTLAIVGLVVSLGLILLQRNRLYGWFHPLVLLSILAALDVYVPALLWIIGSEPLLPWWVGSLTVEDLPEPLLFYLAFFLVMTAPMALASQTKIQDRPAQWVIRWKVLSVVLLVVLGMALAEIQRDIATYGNWQEWIWSRARIRWSVQVVERSVLETVVASAPWRILFNLLAFVGFYHGAGLHRRFGRLLYRRVYPTIAVALALTTFYRGSILLTMAGFLFIEFVRRRVSSSPAESRGLYRLLLPLRAARSRGVVAVGGLAIVLVFMLAGAVRDSLSEGAWSGTREMEPVRAIGPLIKQVSQGAGLIGVAWIMREYGRNEPLWGGETYLDALLLPVPRALYQGKAERPGLLKITSALGEPESTQSAVTMPGEAFANFGYWGLLLAPVFGILFATLFRFTGDPKRPEFFLYPGVVFYVISVGNWMSLTGIMNQAPALVWGWLVLRAVFRRRRDLGFSVCREAGHAEIRETR